MAAVLIVIVKAAVALAAVDQLAGNTGTEQGAAQYAAAVRAANTLAGVKAAAVPVVPAAPAPVPVAQVGSSSSGGGGGSAGETASSQIANAWKQITDSIFEEVKRIRGLIEGTGEDAFAAAQARFGIATAQARAGDQEAAKALPELSQNLLALGETNAQTLLQLRVLQGQTAASLATTGNILSAQYGLAVPAAVLGSSVAPQANNPFVPTVYNPALTSSSNTGGDGVTAQALREMADRMDAIEANTRAGAQHAATLARILARVTPDGDAIETREATA